MFTIYRITILLFFPVIVLFIFFRSLVGKENFKSIKEKIFITEKILNKNNVIWFHGASLGEINSVIKLIEFYKNQDPKLTILITSNTLSSGKMVKKKFSSNKNILHSYLPVDTHFLVKRFLNIWKPKKIFFIDSEIWPNFINEIKIRKIKLFLINARITNKSFIRWKKVSNFAKTNFSSFNACVTSNEESKNLLKKLGGKNIQYFGNLKFTPSLKNYKKLDKKNLKILKVKKVWCASNTHYNEELFCIKSHLELKKKIKNILTIIVPRHINRVKEIEKICEKFKLKTQILSEDQSIKINSEIVIINSFDVLLKYYNYCKIVFIGKSLVKKLKNVSGQNPLEAAKLGCKIYHGPYVYNFKDIYNYLKNEKISFEVNNHKILSKKMMADFKHSNNSRVQIINKLNKVGDKIFKKTVNYIEGFN